MKKICIESCDQCPFHRTMLDMKNGEYAGLKYGCSTHITKRVVNKGYPEIPKECPLPEYE